MLFMTSSARIARIPWLTAASGITLQHFLNGIFSRPRHQVASNLFASFLILYRHGINATSSLQQLPFTALNPDPTGAFQFAVQLIQYLQSELVDHLAGIANRFFLRTVRRPTGLAGFRLTRSRRASLIFNRRLLVTAIRRRGRSRFGVMRHKNRVGLRIASTSVRERSRNHNGHTETGHQGHQQDSFHASFLLL
jgi:hypothetical protein